MEEKIKKFEVVKDNEDEVIQGGQEVELDHLNGNYKNQPIEECHEKMVVVSSTKMKMSKEEALVEFRCMVEDAIRGNYILEKPKGNVISRKDVHRDISLWGVPLLPSKGHEGTDTVLLKFLKTNDFKVLDAFEKLRKTLKWRKEFNTDTILEEELYPEFAVAMYINSIDKQGHPLCYNSYGVFKDKELYKKVLGSEENRAKFLRWKIQSMEKSISKLSFKNGGAESLVQITDLKNAPGPDMKELHVVSKKALNLVQANYPEIVHRHILINVPFWYYTSHIITSKLISSTSRKKLVFARPSRVTQTLLKYIGPEQLPTKYGGLNRDNDNDFFPDEDKASEMFLGANKTKRIKVPVAEAGLTIVWDFTVVGWEVSYKEEFIPDDEGSYKVLLRKGKLRRMGESVRNSFYISEPGKIVITLENSTLKKKRVYYRHKARPTMSKFINFKQ